MKHHELKGHIRFKNLELLHEFEKKGKSIIVTIGHCSNWEWMAMALPLFTPLKVYAVYKPFSNRFFDEYMVGLRTLYYSDCLIPFKQAYRFMIRHKGQQTITILAADQTPPGNEIQYWTRFMNQPTPFYVGTEKIAKSLGFPVLFFDIQSYKRGFYEIEISVISDDPANTDEYEITNKYVEKLEQSIRHHPDNWLWSHRKWKHQPPDSFFTDKEQLGNKQYENH